MIGYLLTGHGSFAPGLAGALEMIAGKVDYFEVVPFTENMAVSAFEEKLTQTVKKMRDQCQGVLIFTDLLGGTPFKAAMLTAQAISDVEVLTGTNLPMLIEVVGSYSVGKTLPQLIQTACETGSNGISHAKLILAKDTGEQEEGI